CPGDVQPAPQASAGLEGARYMSSEELRFDVPGAGRRAWWSVALVTVVVVGALFAFGYLRHRAAAGEVTTDADGRMVRVEGLKPTVHSGTRDLELPGTVKALEETKVWARVTGYVK